MRSIAADRPWPPDPSDELATPIHAMGTPPGERWQQKQYTMILSLLELSDWLDEDRPFEMRSDNWKSLCDDIHRGIRNRGQHLRLETPSLDEIDQVVKPALATQSGLRTQCRKSLKDAFAELASPTVIGAAFNDLVDIAESAEGTFSLRENRLAEMAALMRLSGRSTMECQTLASILDNTAEIVLSAKHQLEGGPLPEPPADWDTTAGLSSAKRIDLCRRLLDRPHAVGRHIVWLAYAPANIPDPEPVIEIGPITFYDGPTLLRVLPEGSNIIAVPEELQHADVMTRHIWPHEPKHWVAVRVDLGECDHRNPVQLAVDQCDLIMGLASFVDDSSGWSRLRGHTHFVDGRLQTRTLFIGSLREEQHLMLDHTTASIRELAPLLSDQTAPYNRNLAELVTATEGFRRSSPIDPPEVSVVQAIQAIELVAQRSGADTWQGHTAVSLKLPYAQGAALAEIMTAADRALRSSRLHQSELSAELESLESKPGQGPDDHSMAIRTIQQLQDSLPNHSDGSRQLRSVARHIRSRENVVLWVDALLDDFDLQLKRLRRVRNSMAHGGPIHAEVCRTVNDFARQLARLTVSIALNGLVRGQTVGEAHQMEREQAESWHSGLGRTDSVERALLG